MIFRDWGLNSAGRLLVYLTGLLLGGGCVHLGPHCERAQHQPVPAAMAEQFARSPEETVRVAESQRELGSAGRINWIELTVTASQPATNFTVTCEYFPHPSQPAPVVLIMPMAGGGYPIERYFARYFNRHGFAAIILHRRKFLEKSTVEGFNAWIMESVKDGRRALDWAQTRPELDAKRNAIFGISAGGMKGTLLAALDPRIKAAVLGLAGCDLPYLLAHSAEPEITRLRKRLLLENEMTLPQLEAYLRSTIRWDPGQAGDYLECDRVFLVIARYDHVIPFRKSWELRARLGRPEALLLPTGHYSAALCIPCIELQSLRFFERKLGMDPMPFQRLRSPKDTAP